MPQFIGGPFDGETVSAIQQFACRNGDLLKVPFARDIAAAMAGVFGDGIPIALYRPNAAGDFECIGEDVFRK
jgi:hypothetical protein